MGLKGSSFSILLGNETKLFFKIFEYWEERYGIKSQVGQKVKRVFSFNLGELTFIGYREGTKKEGRGEDEKRGLLGKGKFQGTQWGG